MANRVGKHLWRTSKLRTSKTEEDAADYNSDLQGGGGTTSAESKDSSFVDEELEGFLKTEKSLGTLSCFYYAMNFEPLKERKEKIIMIAEAYAIFGALFMNGVWFISEFGHIKDFENKGLERAFDMLCSLCLVSTTFIAMFGSFLWILSISFSGNQPAFLRNAVQYLCGLMVVLNVTFFTVISSLVIAVYNRLHENTVDAIVILVIVGIIAVYLMIIGNNMFINNTPLELYHAPLWYRMMYHGPVMALSGIGNSLNEVKEKSKARAAALQKLKLSSKERPSIQIVQNEKVEALLQKACKILGRDDVDVTPYVKKLQLDWYDDLNRLKGENIDVLSKYMPRGLAVTVHGILQEENQEF